MKTKDPSWDQLQKTIRALRRVKKSVSQLEAAYTRHQVKKQNRISILTEKRNELNNYAQQAIQIINREIERTRRLDQGCQNAERLDSGGIQQAGI